MAVGLNFSILTAISVILCTSPSEGKVDCITCVHRPSKPNRNCLNFGYETNVDPAQLSSEHKEVYDDMAKGSGADGKNLIYQCATFCGTYKKTEQVFVRSSIQEDESSKDKCRHDAANLFDGYWCFCDTHQCNIHKPNDVPSCPFAKNMTTGGGGNGTGATTSIAQTMYKTHLSALYLLLVSFAIIARVLTIC